VDEELFEAARAAGVQLSRSAYDETVEKERPDLLRVDVSSNVEGSYANLVKYLRLLERSPQLFLLTDLSLVGLDGSQVSLVINMAIYFRRVET